MIEFCLNNLKKKTQNQLKNFVLGITHKGEKTMNKTILALGLFAAVLSSNAMAQSEAVTAPSETATSTSTVADFYSKLKNGPVHLSLLSGVESMKTLDGDSYVYDGYSTFHLATVSGKITAKDSLSGTVYYRTDDPKNEAGTQEWYRTYLTYKRTLLTQEEAGVGVYAEMYGRYYPTYARRASGGNNGMIRPALNVSRSFDSGLFLSSKLHYAHNIAKSGQEDRETRSTGYIYLITSQAYNFTDKLSVSFLQEWIHSYMKGETQRESGNMAASLELGYQVHPQVYAGIYTTGIVMNEHDGNFLYDDFHRQLTYGFNMSLTVF